jgi:transposase
MSTAAPTPGPVTIDTTSVPSLADLPDDVATLKHMMIEVILALRQQRQDNEALRFRLDGALRRLYGRCNERYDPHQPWLFADMAAAAGQAPQPAVAAKESSPTTPRCCRPHGRRRLPSNLPRDTKHHELSEAERLCSGCGQVRSDIGADRSEQLEYRPASMQVIEHVRHKYACARCSKGAARSAASQTQAEEVMQPGEDKAPVDKQSIGAEPTGSAEPAPTSALPVQDKQTPTPSCGVITAPGPVMPIAKGLAGPGLLAHLIVCKYIDHLPLHRLERVYERQGVFLPRSTLCDWLAASAQLLLPLYQLMVSQVLQSRVIHTDDTPVDMQTRKPRTLVTARLWTYLGDHAHPYNVFDFTTSRKRDGPQQFLAKFQGYLQADAFSGYDCLYLPSPSDGVARIKEVACNAHARRKFYDARTSDDVRAHLALGYYSQLYILERHAKGIGFDHDERRRMRQDIGRDILASFRAWLDKARLEVLPKSPMGEAIGYALNNWEALNRYTDEGFLEIDNNIAEREMKRVAIGRKNWLFVGSEQGGKTAAVLMSFTSTCVRLQVEPWAYLHDVLTRLPTATPDQLPDLLPDRWLAANSAAVPSVPAMPPSEPIR